MVRLLPVQPLKALLRRPRFNPTMVRLLRVCSPIICTALPAFQSHYGAIATVRSCLLRCFLKSFNPTMVRLLPSSNQRSAMTSSCFNPTMVRLLPSPTLTPTTRGGCFNPTMVRLLLARNFLAPTYRFVVSIPLWCDCYPPVHERPQGH